MNTGLCPCLIPLICLSRQIWFQGWWETEDRLRCVCRGRGYSSIHGAPQALQKVLQCSLGLVTCTVLFICYAYGTISQPLALLFYLTFKIYFRGWRQRRDGGALVKLPPCSGALGVWTLVHCDVFPQPCVLLETLTLHFWAQHIRWLLPLTIVCFVPKIHST